MLVLSRKEAQRIRVGDSIVVTVVKIAGDKVRVGIEAPSDVLVLRDELEAWDTPAAPRCEAGGRGETGNHSEERSPAPLASLVAGLRHSA